MNKFFFINAFILTLIGVFCAHAYPITNMHEHLQSIEEAPKLIAAMNQENITTTALMGSPLQTIYFSGGFEGYDENNEEMLSVAKTYPGRFIVFVAINPADADKLKKLKKYMQEGATGLKLYTGHTSFYTIPLDDRSMNEIYEYCEKNNIPIMWHVNPYYYQAEFENVLKNYPGLKVVCPHFCLSSINEERFRYLMDSYPNLYTDISFGYDPYAVDGFKRISKNPEKYMAIFSDYQDRFLFGTDNVITNHPRKNEEWIADFLGCYRNMLETEEYSCFMVNGTLTGLNLDDEILEKVYSENPRRFLEQKKSSYSYKKKIFLIGILLLAIIAFAYIFLQKQKKELLI